MSIKLYAWNDTDSVVYKLSIKVYHGLKGNEGMHNYCLQAINHSVHMECYRYVCCVQAVNQVCNDRMHIVYKVSITVSTCNGTGMYVVYKLSIKVCMECYRVCMLCTSCQSQCVHGYYIFSEYKLPIKVCTSY